MWWFCCLETYVRLTGHNSTFAGRVEVFSHGTWGRVIDNYPYYWSKKEADIVCRQLGFPEAITAVRYSAFGEGSAAVMMSGVRCLVLRKLYNNVHTGTGSTAILGQVMKWEWFARLLIYNLVTMVSNFYKDRTYFMLSGHWSFRSSTLLSFKIQISCALWISESSKGWLL